MLCFCSHSGEATSEVGTSIVVSSCVTSKRDMEGSWHEVDLVIAELFWQLGTIREISEMSKGIDSFSATAFGFLKWICLCFQHQYLLQAIVLEIEAILQCHFLSRPPLLPKRTSC